VLLYPTSPGPQRSPIPYAMFRYRRYRIFLVFAVVALFALYKFGSSGASWREAASSAAGQGSANHDPLPGDAGPKHVIAHETRKLEIDVPAASNTLPAQTPPPVASLASPAGRKSSSVTQHKPTVPTPNLGAPHGHPVAIPVSIPDSSSVAPVYWSKVPENFPVPSESLIKLPSGKPSPIPKIQFKFKPESPAAKADRESKLDTIRNVFKKSWKGYKDLAWLHDELKPVSGEFKDPFANWGATLVDALDTLWIMGLKDEFEDAVKGVAKIDFTTTPRADIPLFETTIRYLGGLLAAYDISEKRYKTLLDKAVELAEILISAFDTPNRMPDTYYHWKPAFVSQKHRASSRVVLAEIGSLSMEFTRLAQLTGEQKYYDAIARITDNLEEFQMKTRLPGMWPTFLDASGCGRAPPPPVPAQEPLKAPANWPADDVLGDDAIAGTPASATTPTSAEKLSPDGKKYLPLNLPKPVLLTPNGANPTWVAPKEGSDEAIAMGLSAKKGTLGRRQLDVDLNPSLALDLDADLRKLQEAPKTVMPGIPLASPVVSEAPACISQGFVSTSDYGREEYTLGGMSDSTYEYLPKQYLLLGGRVEKYRTMYEASMKVVKKHLLFRPMLPKEEDILFSGKYMVASPKDSTMGGELEAENAHLTCFAGGMFGLGAKIFDRPEDMEIAEKLTEGCVWSYDMTPTGIMPESFEVIACEDAKECAWNETLYTETLDPRSDYRLERYQEQLVQYQQQYASASKWYDEQMAAFTAAPTTPINTPIQARATPTSSLIYADTLDRRQLAHLVDDAEELPSASASASASPSPAIHQDHNSVMGGEPEEGEGPPTKAQPLPAEEASPTKPEFPYLWSPTPPLNHAEYVHIRVQEERLPKGVTRIGSRNYILRYVFSLPFPSFPFPSFPFPSLSSHPFREKS
jgi:mannosyl-oligosaccharide alpha-1,2-mannosidase